MDGLVVMKAVFLKTLVTAIMGVATVAAQAAVEVKTAHGNVQFKLPLSDNIVVYDVGALDSIHALGITPKGTSTPVNVSYLQDVYKQATVVGSLFEPDLEKLNAFKPEAVIIGGRMAPKYNDMKPFVPVVDMSTPQGSVYSISRTKETMTEYGKLFAQEAKAAELNQALDTAFEQTKKLTQGKKALMVLVNGQKVASYSVGSRFGYLFDDLGFIPLDERKSEGRHGNPISFEFIKEKNPDWLIVMDRTTATNAKGDSAKVVLDNALLKDVTAFKNNQVIYLDSSAYLASGGYQQMMLELKLLRDAMADK